MKTRLVLVLPLLALLAAAQNTAGGAAEIEQLQVKRDGGDVMIQIVLTGSVKPSIETAINPDRLVLVLPGTVADAKQKHFPLDANGVRAVRMGLNSANPPVTRVVVDLDSAHEYSLDTEGKTITLRVQGNDRAVARRNGPAPAASAPLIGGLRRKDAAAIPAPPVAQAPIPVPPKFPPINFPEKKPSTTAAQSNPPAPITTPSATHPKTGSLQEGTVFPGMGTPGAGSVPSTQVAATAPTNSVTIQNVQPATSLTPPTTSGMAVTATKGSATPAASAPASSMTVSTGPAAKPNVSASVTQTPAPAASDPTQLNATAADTGKKSSSTSPTTAQSAPATAAASSGSSTSSAGSPNITAKVLSATVAPTQTTAAPTSPATTDANAKAAAAAPAVTQPAPAVPEPVAVAVKPVPAQTSTSASSTPSVSGANAASPAAAPVSAAADSSKAAKPTSTATASASTSPVGTPSATAPSGSTPSPNTAAASAATAPSIPAAPPKPIATETSVSGIQGASVSNPLGLAPGETVQMAEIEETPPPTTATEVEQVPTIVMDLAGDKLIEVVSAPTPKPTKTVIATAVEPDPATALALRAAHPDFRTSFKVKYVAAGAAYLDGGRAAGLGEGMKLVVRETATGANIAAADGNGDDVVAELEVTSVAETSAVTDVHTPKRDVKPGDLAYLSAQDEQSLVQQSTTSATRKYPTVISFTEGDTLDEEARVQVPRPPMPSVNRARGRFGFDYMGTQFRGSTGGTNTSLGLVTRLDMTRIGGTYWNASGYWRGSFTKNSYSSNTLQDLINRTYHIQMTYDNPHSAWVAGFGRMYLPWATSLDTIDGGYFGRRMSGTTTVGVFAGSTPDPTSWSYSPDRRIGGAFVNFEGGSYDGLHYTSTAGAALSTLKWKIDRPFLFFENSASYKRYVSIYDSLQLDSPVGLTAGASPGPGVGRNFTTVRFQPHERIEFDANYTYFRDLPTFDTALIGTDLLDKYLFQGFSGGVRVEVLKQIWIYTNLGRSQNSGTQNSTTSGTTTTGDTKPSWNQLYGITFGRLPWVHVHVDGHYARFNSSFGSGNYESFSISRNLNDNFRLELLGGQQNFASPLSSNTKSKFVTSNLEFNFGGHYFMQGGFTASRGVTQDYDQWLFTLGYRFDTRRARGQ